MNNAPDQVSPETECPTCKSPLSRDGYEKALRNLEKALIREFRQKIRMEQERHRAEMAELKAMQKQQLRSVINQEKSRKKELVARFNEKTQSERKRHGNEIKEVKRRYQIQMEQLRASYSEQHTTLQHQIRSEQNRNLSELLKRYEGLSSNMALELQRVQIGIEQLEKHLGNDPARASRLPSSPGDNGPERQQEVSVPSVRREDLEEKRLEVERLRKIQEISEMIKEITQKNLRES